MNAFARAAGQDGRDAQEEHGKDGFRSLRLTIYGEQRLLTPPIGMVLHRIGNLDH